MKKKYEPEKRKTGKEIVMFKKTKKKKNTKKYEQ